MRAMQVATAVPVNVYRLLHAGLAGCLFALIAQPGLAVELNPESCSPGGGAVLPQLSLSQAEIDAHLRPRHAALAASPHPRDQAAAALLEFSAVSYGPWPGARRENQALLERAALQAEGDGLLQWLAQHRAPRLSLWCGSEPGRPPQASRLAQLDPGNGLVWSLALDLALRTKDPIGVDAALQQMAQARDFDDHGGEMLQLLLDTAARQPQTGWSEAEAGPSGLSPPEIEFALAATALRRWRPNLHGLVRVCAAEDLRPDRRALCTRIGRGLADTARSLGQRLLGYDLLQRDDALSPADASQWRELQELDARNADGAALPGAAARWRLLRSEWLRHGDEIRAVRALVQWQGPVPPRMILH